MAATVAKRLGFVERFLTAGKANSLLIDNCISGYHYI